MLADSANNVVTATRATGTRLAVAIYPNPTTSTIHLRTPGPFNYQVYDAAGKVVEHGTGRDDFEGGRHLRPGLYLVRVQTADGQQTTAKVRKE